MALNNGNIVSLCNLIRNSNLQGGDITEDEWQQLINSNSQKLFTNLLGNPKLYQLNAPIERRGAGVSRLVEEKLYPFYRREVVPVAAGVADFSAKTIGYLLAINPSTITGRGFDELSADEVADRLGSAVVAPTEKDPCFVWNTSNSILVYPSTITSITLYYYTFPTDAVVAYTTDPTTLLQSYDTANSVETGWGDTELIDIAYMMLRDLGVNMERVDLTQYAQNIVANE